MNSDIKDKSGQGSVLDLKREAFGLRINKVYNREEYARGVKMLKRKIARAYSSQK